MNTLDIDSLKKNCPYLKKKNIGSIYLITVLFLTWHCMCTFVNIFSFLYLMHHWYVLREINIHSFGKDAHQLQSHC